MKSRKTRMFAALGLVAISGFLIMAVLADDITKHIILDPGNAVQTIPTIIFRGDAGDNSNQVFLTNVTGKRLIRIDTANNNFILSQGGSNVNGSNSTILGGIRNKINGSYSAILAGKDNYISASHATIAGGANNQVNGNYGAVAGGDWNVAGEYAVVVGGERNTGNGQYSVVVGNSNTAAGSNSVAMGSGATVEGSNSFLWNGSGSASKLTGDNKFAVMGGHGMVVNTEDAHRFAKLTIGGSLLVEGSTRDASECNSTLRGTLKVKTRTDGQICFCSCDGSNWHSLFGAGKCSSVCDTTESPSCDYSRAVKNCNTTPYSYSGACLRGDVVEGDGAYFVDNQGRVHWTCQTNDGATAPCVWTVNNITGTCVESDPDPKCSGKYDDVGAVFVTGSDTGFTGVVNAVLYTGYSDTYGKKCAWYCPAGTEKVGNKCKTTNNPCGANFYVSSRGISYWVDYLENGVSIPVTANEGGRTCTNTATCRNGHIELGDDSCGANVCQGTKPANATLNSNAAPSNNTTSYFCNATSTAPCSYTCPSGYECDGTTGCKPKCTGTYPTSPSGIQFSNATPTAPKNWFCATNTNQACSFKCPTDWECSLDGLSCVETHAESTCTSIHYGCTDGGASHTNDSDPSKWTWDCPSESGCFECKDGYVEQNGECVCSVNVKFKVLNKDSGAGDYIYVRDIQIRGSGWDPDDVCDLNTVMGSEVTPVLYGGSHIFGCNFNFHSGQSYQASLVLASGLPGNPSYATYDIGNWTSFTPRCGDITVDLNVNSMSRTYYITPSATIRNGNGEVDLDVTVDGNYMDLPSDLGLIIYLKGYDGSSPFNASFVAPGSVNPVSAGRYQGFVGYTTLSWGNPQFVMYDIGFNDSYSKQTTINGDTYIMNRTPSSVPQCGSANGKNRTSAPTASADRCANGSFDNNMTESDEGWTWTCSKNGVTTTPPCQAWKDPVCGSADGTTVSEMPTGTAACNPGFRARPNTGDNQFTWDCGLGPKTVECSANILRECGSAHLSFSLNKPTNGLCNGGTASDPVEGFGGGEPKGPIWEWTCGEGVACYAYIPRVTFNCYVGGNDWSATFTPVGVTPTTIGISQAIYQGFNTVNMNARVKYSCGDGIVKTENCNIEYYCSSPSSCGIFDGFNGRCGFCSYDSQVELRHIEILSLSPSTYNGYRLVEGGSCGNDITYSCQGDIPSGADVNNPTATPSDGNKNYFCDESSMAACSYRCPAGQECEGTTGCKDKPKCVDSTKPTSPSGIQFSSATPTTTKNWFCATDTNEACSFKCPDGYECEGTTGCKPKCTGTYPTSPSGIQFSNATPTAPKNWFCATNTNQACSFKCPTDWECSLDGLSCVETHAESTCTSTHYNCTDGGETNKNYSNHTWTWDCPDELGCSELDNDNDDPNCCPMIPNHAILVYEDEDPADDFAELCEYIPVSTESTTTPDPLACCIENGSFNEQDSNGHQLSVNCEAFNRYTCGDNPYCEWVQGCDQPETVTVSNNRVTGFYCEDGYHLDGCNCVENDDITHYRINWWDASTTSVLKLGFRVYNKDSGEYEEFPIGVPFWVDDQAYAEVPDGVHSDCDYEGDGEYSCTFENEANDDLEGQGTITLEFLPDEDYENLESDGTLTIDWGNGDIYNFELVYGASPSCTRKTCSYYPGYSSSSAGHCYSVKKNLDDGCGGTLTCYKNGCAANGYAGYNCASQASTACSNGYSDIHTMSDGYSCVLCNDLGTVNIETNVTAVQNTNYPSFNETCGIRLRIGSHTYFSSNVVGCFTIGSTVRARFENIPRNVIESAGNIAYLVNHSLQPCDVGNGENGYEIGLIQGGEAEITTMWYCPASQ